MRGDEVGGKRRGGEVRETIRAYDGLWERYAEINASTESIRGYLDHFVSTISGERIIDVGSGHGRDADHFSSRGFAAVGVEPSAGMLKAALRLTRDSPFVMADMRYLCFRGSSFHGLWACSSFLHIPRSQASRVLEEFHRVLRGGGLLFISVKIGEGEGFEENNVYDGPPRFYSFYSEDKLSRALVDAGFRVEPSMNRVGKGWISVFASKS